MEERTICEFKVKFVYLLNCTVVCVCIQSLYNWDFFTGRGKGTPLLRNGIRCIGVELDDESEASDWHGFD
jgi:hypothetical protein